MKASELFEVKIHINESGYAKLCNNLGPKLADEFQKGLEEILNRYNGEIRSYCEKYSPKKLATT